MRPIDADALETHEQLEPCGNGKYEYSEVVYKDDIDNAPTIELDWNEIIVICDNCGHTIHAKRENCKVSAEPELIRCKDCKHRDPEDKKCDCGHDIRWQLPRGDNWYCADAERRTDE